MIRRISDSICAQKRLSTECKIIALAGRIVWDYFMSKKNLLVLLGESHHQVQIEDLGEL